MIHPRLSVNALSSFNWTFDQDLALWRELGIKNAGLLISKIADDVDGKLARVRDAGINLSTVVVGSINLADRDHWNQGRDAMCSMIDSVARADPNGSVYFPPGRTTGARWDEVLDLFDEAVSPCVEHAWSRGIRLAFESSLRTDASFINTLRDAVDVAQRTGLGLVADFANCWMESGLRNTILKAGPHLALVQIDDVIIGGNGVPAPGGRVQIGDGELPVKRLMQDVIDSGYTGLFDLEVLGPVVEAEGYESSLRRGVVTASALLAEAGL
jgi:sugar phosphate isomerase/epimerase